MVLFAGIAAEALVYGEAEGGENDENLFRSISVLLQPSLSIAQVNDILRLIDFLLVRFHELEPQVTKFIVFLNELKGSNTQQVLNC